MANLGWWQAEDEKKAIEEQKSLLKQNVHH
jgi:hypothetical protein